MADFAYVQWATISRLDRRIAKGALVPDRLFRRALDSYEGMHCSDVRDKIFSIIAHPTVREYCVEKLGEEFSVDYSMSAEAVCTMAAAYWDDIRWRDRKRWDSNDSEAVCHRVLSLLHIDPSHFRRWLSRWIETSKSGETYLRLESGRKLNCNGLSLQSILQKAKWPSNSKQGGMAAMSRMRRRSSLVPPRARDQG
jgi:hypothetical protein